MNWKEIKIKMLLAKEAMNDAVNILEIASHRATVNRIYYAVFYAVEALLLTKELSSTKHSGVRSLFNKEFVHTGLIQPSSGQFYNSIFESRLSGDYDVMIQFENDDDNQWITEA